MATDQLTATSGSGSQATTQSPQTAGQPSTGGTQSGSVQPGTATSLLSGQGGVPLHATALSTVNLSASPLIAVQSQRAVNQPKHHVNAALFGFPGLLLLVAVVFFWTTRLSAKETL